MTDKQRTLFLKNEGDAWYERNHQALLNRVFDQDEPIIRGISRVLPFLSGGGGRLLEIGCGEAKRLVWLNEHVGLECHGIEPSAKAVATARASGVQTLQGTADELPYDPDMFDILVFGFCLYLCDREDLFRIAQEADRVLKADAWIVIHDFYALTPTRREYLHQPGLFSYKMDYRKLFDWHPAYTCFAHEVNHHGTTQFTDDPQEWVATSVLRKKAGA